MQRWKLYVSAAGSFTGIYSYASPCCRYAADDKASVNPLAMVMVVSRSQTLSSTRDYSYGGWRGVSYIDRRTVEDVGGGSFCPFTIIHGLSMLSRISTIAFRGYCVSRHKQIYIATRGNENSAVTRIYSNGHRSPKHRYSNRSQADIYSYLYNSAGTPFRDASSVLVFL